LSKITLEEFDTITISYNNQKISLKVYCPFSSLIPPLIQSIKSFRKTCIETKSKSSSGNGLLVVTQCDQLHFLFFFVIEHCTRFCKLLTYLKSPPEKANVVYLQTSVVLGPKSTLNLSFLYLLIFSTFPVFILFFLLPSGVHLIATLVIDEGTILFIRPIHLHLRLLISTGIGRVDDVLARKVLFEMVFLQVTFINPPALGTINL